MPTARQIDRTAAASTTGIASLRPLPITPANLPKSSRRLVLGGIAGILAGITYIVGFLLFGLELKDLFDGENKTLGAVEAIQFLADHRAIFYLANGLVYILNGFLQIIVACAVYEYLQDSAPNRGYSHVRAAVAAIGCVWGALIVAAGMIGNGGAHVAIQLLENGHFDRAATVWTTVDAVYTDGIGGGNEIVGAIWISWTSVLSFRDGCFHKPINLLGVVAGIAGAVTVVPGLWDEATAVFGILMIVWYVLAGLTLISVKTSTPSVPSSQYPAAKPLSIKHESVPELTI